VRETQSFFAGVEDLYFAPGTPRSFFGGVAIHF
jgi:hypothetical protein